MLSYFGGEYQTNDQHGADGVMVIGSHRVLLLCAIVLMCEMCSAPSASATDNRVKELAKQAGVRILSDSTSDRALQRESAAQVPLNRMSTRSKSRATHLLKNTSQYRRMPTLQYEVDSSMYQYLINHPDVAISTWRVLEISKLSMWQTAPFEYSAKATDGSEGRADVLWRDANQCVFVVEGAYHSPLLPTAIEASALVWLRYRFQRTADGQIVVNQQVETFINFPSSAIEAIAKLASMVTNSILDRNVMEVSLYAQMMSRAVKRDPRWVSEIAGRMEGVPEKRKTELTRVAMGRNPYEQSNAASVAESQLTAAGKSSHQTQLSESKQQLLNAVKSGNVVVMIKRPQNASGAPHALTSRDAEIVNRPSANHQSVNPRPVATEAVSTSKTFRNALPVSSRPLRNLAKSGPISSTNSRLTGFSKAGSPLERQQVQNLTGPVIRSVELMESSETDLSEKTAPKAAPTASATPTEPSSPSEEIIINGQPALVVLPFASTVK